MTVLDATKLESESDLATDIDTGEELANEIESGEETEVAEETEETPPSAALHSPGPLRTFTLDLPTDCQTTVEIRAQLGADYKWRATCCIARKYVTDPYEQSNDMADLAEDDGMGNLGYAILEAVDDAAFWISTHSEDDDEKAKAALAYLESWYDELDVESVTEAIFDPLPEPVAEVASETPAACECETTVPTAVTVSVCSSSSTPGEAKRHWEQRKAEYAWAIADGHMQLADAKARVKSLTKCIENAVERLEQIIEDGPEEMPLFDSKQQQADQAATEAEKDSQPLLRTAPEPKEEYEPAAVPVAEPVEAEDESWRAVLIEATSIPTPICKILNEDNCIYNLGQLVDFQTIDPNDTTKSRPLTELKKIGNAKAEKIEEALMEYWAANPRK